MLFPGNYIPEVTVAMLTFTEPHKIRSVSNFSMDKSWNHVAKSLRSHWQLWTTGKGESFLGDVAPGTLPTSMQVALIKPSVGYTYIVHT